MGAQRRGTGSGCWKLTSHSPPVPGTTFALHVCQGLDGALAVPILTLRTSIRNKVTLRASVRSPHLFKPVCAGRGGARKPVPSAGPLRSFSGSAVAGQAPWIGTERQESLFSLCHASGGVLWPGPGPSPGCCGPGSQQHATTGTGVSKVKWGRSAAVSLLGSLCRRGFEGPPGTVDLPSRLTCDLSLGAL